MFFSYKIEKTELSKETVLNYTCKNCQKQNTTKINIVAKHLVIYWFIPFVSLGLQTKASCYFCDFETKKKHFDDQLILHYQNQKTNAKIPYWHFAGITVIIVLILSIFG